MARALFLENLHALRLVLKTFRYKYNLLVPGVRQSDQYSSMTQQYTFIMNWKERELC